VGSTLGLVYVGDISEICGGVIQNSEQKRFCCKAASACSTKGHKSKVSLSTKTLYVKHTRNGHARLDPNLQVSLIPEDETVAGLMGQDHALEVWVAFFEALHAKSAGDVLHSINSSTGSSSP
jgi:hypothetical protein